MMTMPSAFTVKTGILSSMNVGSHAPNITIGSTTHVWALTVMITRPSTTNLNLYLKFSRYIHTLFLFFHYLHFSYKIIL